MKETTQYRKIPSERVARGEGILFIKDCPLLQPVTCSPEESIVAAAKKIRQHKLRHLYVMDKKKKLLGVFAALDVVYEILAEGKDYKKMAVKDCMKADIVSFAKTEPLTKAIGFMSSTNIFSCPVVEGGKLVGVLSYKDAMQCIMKHKQQTISNITPEKKRKK